MANRPIASRVLGGIEGLISRRNDLLPGLRVLGNGSHTDAHGDRDSSLGKRNWPRGYRRADA